MWEYREQNTPTYLFLAKHISSPEPISQHFESLYMDASNSFTSQRFKGSLLNIFNSHMEFINGYFFSITFHFLFHFHVLFIFVPEIKFCRSDRLLLSAFFFFFFSVKYGNSACNDTVYGCSAFHGIKRQKGNLRILLSFVIQVNSIQTPSSRLCFG